MTNDRLILNEPTALPEGTEVELALIENELDGEDLAQLHAALDESDAELRAGEGLSGEALIAALRRGEL